MGSFRRAENKKTSCRNQARLRRSRVERRAQAGKYLPSERSSPSASSHAPHTHTHALKPTSGLRWRSAVVAFSSNNRCFSPQAAISANPRRHFPPLPLLLPQPPSDSSPSAETRGAHVRGLTAETCAGASMKAPERCEFVGIWTAARTSV